MSKQKPTEPALREALDTLEDVLHQACMVDAEGLDSLALSAYADGLRLLAKYGYVTITSEYGRRVIASPCILEAEPEAEECEEYQVGPP